jgi:hypothetical protein
MIKKKKEKGEARAMHRCTAAHESEQRVLVMTQQYLVDESESRAAGKFVSSHSGATPNICGQQIPRQWHFPETAIPLGPEAPLPGFLGVLGVKMVRALMAI